MLLTVMMYHRQTDNQNNPVRDDNGEPIISNYQFNFIAAKQVRRG
ncbi:hypothetical protein [Leuconostoc suionicum]